MTQSHADDYPHENFGKNEMATLTQAVAFASPPVLLGVPLPPLSSETLQRANDGQRDEEVPAPLIADLEATTARPQ